MKWKIPAKTFLLGEYAALAEGSAILLTTSPYFELSLTPHQGLNEVHPLSPAGLWWEQHGSSEMGLQWYDPYQGLGGLGASSAQFLAGYLACCHLSHNLPDRSALLNAYYQTAWSGKGLRPSGYDVLAQSLHACVYINKHRNRIDTFNWPFKTLSLILIHTGVKLATHEHLMSHRLLQDTTNLSDIVDKAFQAFERLQEIELIKAINDYHKALVGAQLVAEHSLQLINTLKSRPEILAIKGCGALGADTILILTRPDHAGYLIKHLQEQNLKILATEKNLTTIQGMVIDYFQKNIKNNQENT